MTTQSIRMPTETVQTTERTEHSKIKREKRGNDFEFQITEACVFLRSIFINKRKIYGAERNELKLINVYLIVLRN